MRLFQYEHAQFAQSVLKPNSLSRHSILEPIVDDNGLGWALEHVDEALDVLKIENFDVVGLLNNWVDKRWSH